MYQSSPKRAGVNMSQVPLFNYLQRRDFQSFSTIWCGGGRMRQKDAKFLEVEEEGELLGGSVKCVKTENVWKVLFLFLICKHNWNERWSQQMRIWAKQDNSPARWQTTTAENSKQITNMWKWNYYILPISSCTNNNLVILDCESPLDAISSNFSFDSSENHIIIFFHFESNYIPCHPCKFPVLPC